MFASPSPRSTGAAATTATRRAGTTAGAAVRKVGSALDSVGESLEGQAVAAAPAVGVAVEEAMSATAASLEDVASALSEGLSGFAHEPGARLRAAGDALRGERVGPPRAVRRWPWALGAAVTGAAVAAGVAWVAQREGARQDGRQEPHELRAVIDLPGSASDAPTPAPAPAPAPGQHHHRPHQPGREHQEVLARGRVSR